MEFSYTPEQAVSGITPKSAVRYSQYSGVVNCATGNMRAICQKSTVGYNQRTFVVNSTTALAGAIA